jgi:predicted RNA binding protein YcfA (HicA-like mRNA interferase family)
MSERLPVLRARDVDRALERGASAISRISGSFCRLIHTSDVARRVTVPLHCSVDLKRETLRGVTAQAGFTVDEFSALL